MEQTAPIVEFPEAHATALRASDGHLSTEESAGRVGVEIAGVEPLSFALAAAKLGAVVAANVRTSTERTVSHRSRRRCPSEWVRVLLVSVVLLCCCFASVPASARAADTVIGFDQLPDGTPLPAGTPITTQYESEGIDFSQSPGEAPSVIRDIGAQAPSPPNVLDITKPGEFFNPFITGNFVSDKRQKLAVAVGPPAGMTNATVQLLAYDQPNAQGNVVASSPSTVVTNGFIELTATSASADIESFQVTGRNGDGGVAIDDFTFDNPVGPPMPDFGLALGQVGFDLRQGMAVVDPITITRFNSSGNIDLDISGLPAGVTASFSPPSPISGSSTTLRLSVAPDAPPIRPTTVTITGTPETAGAGTKSHSATLTLDVAANFTLSADQPRVSVASCSSTSVAISAQRAIGFTGPISLSAENLPTGVTAVFDPAVVTNASGNLITKSTLTLTGFDGGPLGDSTITVRGTSTGAPDETTALSLSRLAGRIDSVTPGSGREPQDGLPGTPVTLSGVGFCPGAHVKFAGAEGAVPAAGLLADGTSITADVPRFAVDGPVSVVEPSGVEITPGAPLAIASVRGTEGFAFKNPHINSYSYSDLSEAYGDEAMHISIDFCFPFGCTWVSPVPGPAGLVFWAIVQKYLNDGQCYGYSLAAQRFVHGDEPLRAFSPLGATSPWQLDGPDVPSLPHGQMGGPSPKLLHYIHILHSYQFSAQAAAYYLGEATANAASTNTAARIREQLAIQLAGGQHPLISMRGAHSGHAVFAYDVVDDDAGGFDIYVNDPNTPYLAAEETNGTVHQTNEQASRIHVYANGQWRFDPLSYTGDPGTLNVLPYATIPMHPALPDTAEGFTSLVSPLGASVRTVQIADDSGHFLLRRDGTDNTNPATRLTDAAPLFAINGTPSSRPLYVVGGMGARTLTVEGTTAGTYGVAVTGRRFGATIARVTTSARERDAVRFRPAGGTLAFVPGAGEKRLQLDLVSSTPDGSTDSVAITTTSFASAGPRHVGGDTWQLLPGAGFTYLHHGPATSFTLQLQAAGGTTRPGSFKSAPIQIANGDALSISASSLRDLSRATMRTSIRHANGGVTVRVLRNRSPVPPAPRLTSLAVRRAGPGARLLQISARFPHIPASASVIVAWKVTGPHNARIVKVKRLGAATVRAGARAFSLRIRTPRAGRYRFTGIVSIVTTTPLGVDTQSASSNFDTR